MRRVLLAVLSAGFGVFLMVLSYTVAADVKIWTDVLRLGGLAVFVVSGIELCIRLYRRKRRRPDEPEPAPSPPEKEKPRYAVKRTYLSAAERNFLQLLRGIRPDDYEVIPQVALATVIDKLTMNAYRNELFRIVDFLFVDRDTFEPLLLVELNDASHLKADRAERDRKVAEICESAGMPLVTFWLKDGNTFEEIRKTVLKRIKR